MPISSIPDRIVAELTKSWHDGDELQPGLLSQRFEKAILFNKARSFALESWQLSTVVRDADFTETIIAVFVKHRSAGK